MRTLRKLVLGETWTLPSGIAVAVGAAAVARALVGSHGVWHHVGGWLLFVALALALAVALVPSRRR